MTLISLIGLQQIKSTRSASGMEKSDSLNYTTSLLRLLLCLMKAERMGRALDSQFPKKKEEGFKVERQSPLSLITAPVQSFAAMHRSPRPNFLIFIGLLGPLKANGSVFDEGELLLRFNKPPERVRGRTCLPIGAGALWAGTEILIVHRGRCKHASPSPFIRLHFI